MAIVANKNGTEPLDKSFCFYNRTNAGEPNGVLTPAFAGEIVLDTNNNCLWRAVGVTNNTWVASTEPN